MIRIRADLNKITLLLFLNLFGFDALAQMPMGADALSLGHTTTALQSNAWAMFGNPATMIKDRKVLSFYSFRSYGIIALTDIAAQISVPTKLGTTGLGLHRYGDDLFSETRIRLGYSSQWEGVNFGIVVNYNIISFGGNYGSASALGLDIGVQTPVTEKVSLGARASNVNQPGYNSDEDLPREMAVGFSYKLEERTFLLFDVVKDVRFPVSYRGGVEVHMIDNLVGRIGITTEPNTYSIGLGYNSANWKVNLGFQRHDFLGISPGLDINFLF